LETSVEWLEDTRVNVKLEFTSQEMRSAFGKVYGELSKHIVVPGFRPGKAPRVLLERVLDKEAVREQVVQELVPDLLGSVIEERKLFVVGEPDINYDPPEADQPFVVTAGIAIVPDPKVGDISTISIVRPQVSLSDEEVDSIIEGLREARSVSVEVTDRPVERGDFVRLHYQITSEGEELYDPEDLPMMYLEVGAEWYTPIIDDDLVGLLVGDIKDIAVEYPEDYENPRLAGKPATFQVHIESVSRRMLPELDEEFLRRWDVPDPDGLRLRIREERAAEAQEAIEESVKDQAVAGLIKLCTVQLPELLIVTQADELTREFSKKLKDEEGLTLREYLDRGGMEFAFYRHDMELRAARMLKRAFAVEAVAKERGIEISDEALEESVWALARSARMGFSEMWEMLKESGTLEEMRERKRREKVVELILAEAQVTEREMTFRELASGDWLPEEEPEPEGEPERTAEAQAEDDTEAPASGPDSLDDAPLAEPVPVGEEATPLPPEGASQGPELVEGEEAGEGPQTGTPLEPDIPPPDPIGLGSGRALPEGEGEDGARPGPLEGSADAEVTG